MNVHIIRQSNGNGGLTLTDAYTALNYLKLAFEPHNICISLAGLDEIHNDYFYSNFDLNGMKTYTNTPNAIDIFLGDYNQWNQGMAEGIPGKALAVGGKPFAFDMVLPLSFVIAHELGHCLGLFHTFHGLCELGSCPEYVNGSNCANCGDFVCDTPADPQQLQMINTGNGCFWNGTTCNIPNTDIFGNTYLFYC